VLTIFKSRYEALLLCFRDRDCLRYFTQLLDILCLEGHRYTQADYVVGCPVESNSLEIKQRQVLNFLNK